MDNECDGMKGNEIRSVVCEPDRQVCVTDNNGTERKKVMRIDRGRYQGNRMEKNGAKGLV